VNNPRSLIGRQTSPLTDAQLRDALEAPLVPLGPELLAMYTNTIKDIGPHLFVLT